MTDALQALIDKHHARMRMLREAFERDGRLLGRSSRDPSYSILLTKNGSSEAPYRITSFRGKEPVGHREYDMLDGGGPTQNGLAEFAGSDMQLVLPKPLTKRERERKIKEAQDGIASCEEAIGNSPDQLGRDMFGRSLRIWQLRLGKLTGPT